MGTLNDDGRDLTLELAEAIAHLSPPNPGFIVMAAQIIKRMTRQEQLRFLKGDMRALKNSKLRGEKA